jgi:4-carboxymuconolactone decarboxylase
MSDRRSAGLAVLEQMLPNVVSEHPGFEGDGFGSELGAQTLECVFGRVWVRPGLDRRSRSLLTLGILIATHAWDELRLHFAAALRNGLTTAELEEVVCHAACYAGYPAAAHAAMIGGQVIDGGSRLTPTPDDNHEERT